jgi:hypothetical protein
MVSGLVRSEEAERFQGLLREARRLANSSLAEALVLAATYLLTAWLHGARLLPAQALERFASSSPGWLWYAWVSRPLFQFLLLRWLWRIAIWAIFLRKVSRLSLLLSAGHPDRAGGLGFLAQAHASFGLVAFPFAITWAAGWRERFLAGTVSAESLHVSLPVFVLVVFVVLAGPLILFTPKLFRVRQQALLDYGTFAAEYCRLFERRWLQPVEHSEESLLGTSDVQSFADLQNTVAAVRATLIVPFDRSLLVALVIGTGLPLLALLTLVFPVRQLLRYALTPFL